MVISRHLPESTSATPCHEYAAYGLRLRSDIPLPLPLASHSEEAQSGVVFRRASVACAPEPDGPLVMVRTCQVHGDVIKVFRGPGGIWFWLRSIGTFHALPDLRTVAVYPDGCDDERALGHAAIQPVLICLLNYRGMPTLHASAVETPYGCVAFAGVSGQGKSTMTAAFLRRGAALLTDDALPLRVEGGTVCGVPGPPHMKVWSATAQHTLHLDDTLPSLTASLEKKYLALDGRYEYAPVSTPLRAIYVLRRYDPVASSRSEVYIRRLAGRDGLTALLYHTLLRACLRPEEEGAFLPIYAHTIRQAPVRMLTYPSGFEHQDAVHDAVLEDVRTP